MCIENCDEFLAMVCNSQMCEFVKDHIVRMFNRLFVNCKLSYILRLFAFFDRLRKLSSDNLRS
jgi:hypothetical protein